MSEKKKHNLDINPALVPPYNAIGYCGENDQLRLALRGQREPEATDYWCSCFAFRPIATCY